MKILEVINNFIDPFSNLNLSIFLVGSSAWRGNDYNKINDIDIEAIYDNNKQIESILKNKKAVPKASRNIFSNIIYQLRFLNLGVSNLKFKIDDKDVSIRFMQKELFNNICSLNIKSLSKTKSVYGYRNIPASTIDTQCNFAGERINYSCSSYYGDFGQIIEIPVAIIDSNKKFYPGQVIDRLLSFPKIITDNHDCYGNFSNLKKEIIRRMNWERKNNLHKKEVYLDNCLCRKDQIGKNLLDALRKEGKQ